MIGLCFSTRPVSTRPIESWWDRLARRPREEFWPGVQAEFEVRLKYQGSIPQPTARKLKERKHSDRDAITGEVLDD